MLRHRRRFKVAMFLFIVIPKMLIAGTLLAYGTGFLVGGFVCHLSIVYPFPRPRDLSWCTQMHANGDEELILNTLALTFVMEVSAGTLNRSLCRDTQAENFRTFRCALLLQIDEIVYAAFTPEETREAVDNLPPIIVDTSIVVENEKGTWNEGHTNNCYCCWRNLLISLFYKYVLQTVPGKVCIIVALTAGMYARYC